MWDNVGGTGPRKLVTAVGAVVRGPSAARELTQIRCERGAEIAYMLDLPDETAAAIRCLDEHWDGRGHPVGLAGDAIPLLARILNIAQVAEVFYTAHGREAAYETVRARSGRWFDPTLVGWFEEMRRDEVFWATLADGTADEAVAELEPAEVAVVADDSRLDRVAEAFALAIDAKSPYTFRHSERVAELAVGAGLLLGFDERESTDLRRAGLLHDTASSRSRAGSSTSRAGSTTPSGR